MTLSGFPRRTLRGDRTVYRIHRHGKGPWWFSTDGSGRFDPVGTAVGTCYLAERPLGAWVEVFRKQMLLAEDEITERRLLSVAVGRDLRLADVTSRRALKFGVTASLGSAGAYDESQAFAAQAVEAGFDGVRYLVRHDPAQRLYGIALFSIASALSGPQPPGTTETLPEDLVAEASKTFGYRILPTP